MKPFFSVVIPLYNKENYIVDTLNSVINQTFTDFEIILVNDGSNDSSLEKVENINDSRLKLFTIENSGVSKARNFGINIASANNIAFLDADDIWKENHLSELNKLYGEFSNCGLYANAYLRRHKKFNVNSDYKNIPNKRQWRGIIDDFFKSSITNCVAWTSAVMIPKKIIEDIGGFDEDITLGAGEDTDLWIRIALKHKVAFNSEVTAIHNLHADNRLTKSNTKHRKYLNLDKYENHAKNNASLKQYLDINRFSIGIQYKLSGNNKKAKDYFNKLELKNLNLKQQFLLNCNTTILKLMINIQSMLREMHINLSPFK